MPSSVFKAFVLFISQSKEQPFHFPFLPESKIAEEKEKLEKYNMEKEVVRPKSEATIKKFQKQHLTTDTGIEITIPMEEYKDPEKVEFITNPDGTISVLIKNIGHLSTR